MTIRINCSQLGVVLTFQDVDGSSTKPLHHCGLCSGHRVGLRVYTNPQSGKDHPDL
ncbi:hypothetical protein DPMN_079168 [Dreissena polymorpha]|uniref:Uncharacterized protein n=1 Tax=Dreissena polymorpha TaxID=45954 RepID=A0A9D3YU03_DREPO|nr:hypothetical protein DPMN_079168 [Dreissena polymorpha]